MPLLVPPLLIDATLDDVRHYPRHDMSLFVRLRCRASVSCGYEPLFSGYSNFLLPKQQRLIVPAFRRVLLSTRRVLL